MKHKQKKNVMKYALSHKLTEKWDTETHARTHHAYDI